MAGSVLFSGFRNMAGQNQSQVFSGWEYWVYALGAGDGLCGDGGFTEFCEVVWRGIGDVLLLIVTALQWSRRASPSAAWMECRVLAERLRCTAFLAMCGL